MGAKSLPVERWFWPIASFGLLVMIGAQIVGIGGFFSSEVLEFTQGNSGLLNLILVSGVLAAITSIFVAVYVASHDQNLSPQARTRWTLVIVLTNVYGGPLFLVTRWWQHRQRKNQ
jgi:hypothetical protein